MTHWTVSRISIRAFGEKEHLDSSRQRHGAISRWHVCAFVVFLLIAVVVSGCDRGPILVPVTGKVLYNGKPLAFGSVTFQPPSGQPARGEIQGDGTFVLSTYRMNDGAVVGNHKVRVACYESQRKDAVHPPGEQSLGRLLIPKKYTLFDQSGLTAEVREQDNQPLVFELTGQPG